MKALAEGLGITLRFLPRLWKFTKRRSLSGRCHPIFRRSQEAIQEVLDGIPTIHAEALTKLMTLNFPQFDAVSLLSA